jgi:lipoprotein-anchoring transpeptidase ErfK/SrfK
MRRGRWVAGAALCVGTLLAGDLVGVGAVFGEPPSSTIAPSDATATAERGTAVQLTPTLPPPPPTTQPPPAWVSTVLPTNSGSGRRVVYSRGRMRVWIIDGNENVVRTYPVSGHKYRTQPTYGTYKVFSRSTYTCNIEHTYVCMRWMVRFTKGPSGDNIGFHEIPRSNGYPVQTDAQLGTALSSGCVRQGTDDAWFMWNWASIGTVVVVVP